MKASGGLAVRLATLGVLVLAAGLASAQIKLPHPPASTNRCMLLFPFMPTEANRVPARELFALFAGKRAEYFRVWDPEAPLNKASRRTAARPTINSPPPAASRGPPLDYLYNLEWRADGSFRTICAWRYAKNEDYGPCATRPGGTQDSGAWRIADGAYCAHSTYLESRGENCHSIHRQDGRYAAKLVKGTGGCFAGEIVFK
jgi:hypothetical protein